MEEIRIEYLLELHEKENSPALSWQVFSYNWCWSQYMKGRRFVVTENGKIKWDFTGAGEFNDKRKPNEIQTTD